MNSRQEPKHWLIRVQDGENFRNSKYQFWGVKRGSGGGIKTIVNKIQKGDILWFMTSKPYGGKLIGPLLIGLGLPIEVAPLRSSPSEILNLASIAAYSSEVIDYKN